MFTALCGFVSVSMYVCHLVFVCCNFLSVFLLTLTHSKEFDREKKLERRISGTGPGGSCVAFRTFEGH